MSVLFIKASHTYCFNAFAGLYELMLLHDGGVVNILAENVTQSLQALDLAFHVRPVLLFDGDGARILYFGLEHF